MEALRRSTVLLAVGSWLVLLRGLWFGDPTTDQTLDLEAGGGFAANVEVGLPTLALTLALVAVVILGVTTRAWVVAAVVVSTTTAAFAAWVLTRGYLLDYLPSLGTHLRVSIGLAVIAAWIAVLTMSDEPGVPRSRPGSA